MGMISAGLLAGLAIWIFARVRMASSGFSISMPETGFESSLAESPSCAALALADLESDYRRGKITDADYAEMRRLVLRAAANI